MATKFSVIIPFHERTILLDRAFHSLSANTFGNFEVIAVNDASRERIKEYPQGISSSQFRQIDLKIRSERVAAYNAGMEKSLGEWICWLDSDDEYMSNYLSVLNDAIDKFPEYKIFNFGSIIQWHRHKDEYLTKIGKPFHMDEPHMNFRSGVIGTGRFIFHRSILDTIPLMKPALRPYGNPGCFPEVNRNPNYPMREDGQWVPMGDPWGNDYHWFWLMTRKFETKTLDMLLYIEHKRKS